MSPFLGNSNIETFSNITNCNYTLDEEQFDVIRSFNIFFHSSEQGHSTKKSFISSEGKDFIQKLLVVDPDKRMTASECLEHSWILDTEDNTSRLEL